MYLGKILAVVHPNFIRYTQPKCLHAFWRGEDSSHCRVRRQNEFCAKINFAHARGKDGW